MTKRVRLSGIKAGITLYRVRSFVQGKADAPTRFVGHVERLHVTGRPVPHDLGGATYGWMAYKIHWMAAVEAYDTKSQGWVIGYGHDDGFDGDMGLKGWRQGLYRTKCFRSLKRATAYRNMLLTLPITPVEIEVHEVGCRLDLYLDDMIEDHEREDQSDEEEESYEKLARK